MAQPTRVCTTLGCGVGLGRSWGIAGHRSHGLVASCWLILGCFVSPMEKVALGSWEEAGAVAVGTP